MIGIVQEVEQEDEEDSEEEEPRIVVGARSLTIQEMKAIIRELEEQQKVPESSSEDDSANISRPEHAMVNNLMEQYPAA